LRISANITKRFVFSDRERMIVLLTFYAERSARQVGEEMTTTEGHVRVARHRAMGKLRACMSAAGAVQ
jgi:DNA-directed RNA polymerase specialized sigma24 family protein